MTVHSQVLTNAAVSDQTRLCLLRTTGENGRRKLDEELGALAVRATGDLIWDWDVPSGSLSWNDKISSSYGYDRGDVEPTLQWWIDRIHPEDRVAVVAHIM